MKKALFVFLLIASAATLFGCKSKDTFEPRTIHNTRLGIDVSLGMDKSDVDELLGNSELTDSSYFYTESGLFVIYKEGKAVMLIISDNSWTSIYDTNMSMTPNEIESLCGIPFRTSQDESYSYAFDEDTQYTNNNDEVKTIILYSFSDNKLEAIAIADKG